ncbi:hypothetical protein DEO72_LG8g1999 [Vigna unguiculata]|uniref:Uncharacterized protein n=1 Tax=Vigna unguiculata TaxID=3917 RepID=A0A4D6MVP7_VIGUN|nr:hypothetical protein DEO72_LG8g1999 [Vigna unguiculata]
MLANNRGFTDDTITLHSPLTRNAATLGPLLRFSRAFKTGVALIHFAAVRSRLPDTAVSDFSRLKVIADLAVTVEGIATVNGARGLRGLSPRDHPSSVHVTTRDHMLFSWFSASDLMLGYWILRRESLAYFVRLVGSCHEECEKGLTVDGRVEDECGVCNSRGIGEWTIAVNIRVMEAHVLSAAFGEWKRQG